jgi:hypothetical protein
MRPPRSAALVFSLVAAATALAQEQPPAPQPADAPPAPAGDPAAPPPVPEAGKPKRVVGAPPPDSPTVIPRGLAGESMWRAPTAEDLKKPVLLTFQRTWADALAIAKETGKPILVCVNMDGEPASEHYSGVRYRDPEIAPLYMPYVCVIASVYRHTPRDYDDEGNRVLCPRFGSVTCGEHIAIEPFVFENFLDGKRIAPRHIMVEPNGDEIFDVYFANDVASVLRTIVDGIKNRAPSPPAKVRGDRPIVERVDSRDVGDRTAVESAYAKGDAATRKALLDAALAHPEAAPVDLLRLAVFGLDVDLSAAARKALAATDAPAATDLISESLRIPMSDAERDQLIAALARIGQNSPRAQWLAVLHQGLAAKSGTVDAAAWTKTVESSAVSAAEWYDIEARLRTQSVARRERPDDPKAWIEFADASLAAANKMQRDQGPESKTERSFAKLAFADAKKAALEAERLGAKDWRIDADIALADYYCGDTESAFARAENAVKAMPAGEPGWNAMAVLTVFAEGRFRAIKKAVREKQRWPGKWLADVNSAYAVLLRHPMGTDAQVVWHYDFLTWLGAWDRASRALDEGLARFSDSAALHDLFRRRVLRERGIEGLEAAYDAKLAEKDPPKSLARFAAVASTDTADYFRRGGNMERAFASYDRAIAHWESAAKAEPEWNDAAGTAVALLFASRARIYLERGDDEKALTELIACFERSPTSAATQDGMGFSPAMTASTLLARLTEAKRDDLVAKLNAATAKIDPALLVLKTE